MPNKVFGGSALTVVLAAGVLGGLPAQAHADQQSDGSGGVASGNQIHMPLDVAVNVCGNSVAVLGVSQAQCVEVAEELAAAEDNGASGQESSGSEGVASGNQVHVPVDAEVEVCGNAVAVLGVATAECYARPGEEQPEQPDDEPKEPEDETEEPEEDPEKPEKEPEDDPRDDDEQAPDDSKPQDAEKEPGDTEAAALPITGASLGAFAAAAAALLAAGATLLSMVRRRLGSAGGGAA
jgi:outer membrane biosynthesis protein TonB